MVSALPSCWFYGSSSLKMSFLLSMASKCDFGISWERGLGVTLAKKQEVLVLKLHGQRVGRQVNRDPRERLDPECLLSTGQLHLKVGHARFASLWRSCVALVHFTFVCYTNSVKVIPAICGRIPASGPAGFLKRGGSLAMWQDFLCQVGYLPFNVVGRSVILGHAAGCVQGPCQSG